MSDVDNKRRNLMKGGALGAIAIAAFGTGYDSVFKHIVLNEGREKESIQTEFDPNITLVRSICLQCHSGCGIQGRVLNRTSDDAIVLKIDGNPFHANTYQPHLDYTTDLDKAKVHVGSICAKGQAGVQTLYDPQRLKHPLKRVGARGSGKWKRITWEQFYEEIIEGSTLPKKDGGEYNFVGMKDLLTDDLIDANQPWLGSKRNQIAFLVGRSEHGRKELSDRIFGKIFGTINKRIDHTSICEQSHHIGFKEMTGKTHMKPDFDNSDMVIVFGGSYLDANFPFSANVPKVMRFKERGGKLVVVDPRFSNTAKHADYWFPIMPGTDAALALAIARIIFDEDLYDTTFLSAPNLTAANANGEASASNATHLVNLTTHKIVTMADVGLDDGTNDDHPVVWSGGNYADGDVAASADLLPGEITLPNSDLAKTAFELYRDEAMSKTLDQWLEICGITDMKEKVIEVAREFAKRGKRTGADLYRGAVQHTNGYYNAVSIIALNLLVGNIDWKGGMSKGGSHWHEIGTSSTTYTDLSSMGTTQSTSGWILTKEKVAWGPGNPEYDARVLDGESDPKPKRPFYPKTSNVWQEVFGAIESGYPYEIQHVWNHMGNPNYSVPGAARVQKVLEAVKDDGSYKLPVLISVDVVMGEASAYADYVLPDTTYLEQFASPHVAPSQQTTISGIRQPMFGSYDPQTGEYNHKPAPGYENTKMAEDIYIELALKLKEKGYIAGDGVGENAFGITPADSSYPTKLENAWDWYKAIIINVIEDAESDGVVIAGNNMNEKIKAVLDKGGVFEDFSEYTNSGDQLPHKLKKVVKLWSESVATNTHSFSGEKFWGGPKYEPIMDMGGNDIVTEDINKGYKYQLITYKMPIHTQSRTANNPFLKELLFENPIEINEADANGLGIKTGDLVRISSVSNTDGITGSALVTNLVRPGVVSVAHSFGHTHYGAKGWQEDDEEIQGDPFKGSGVNSNLIMRLDDSYDPDAKISLTDPIGGSAVFFDTMIKIEKV